MQLMQYSSVFTLIDISTTALQVCHSSVQETSFASPARVSDGDIFPINPIPLRENKHFTDWSISLDQTNISCAAMDTSENDVDGVENAAKNPRASMVCSLMQEVCSSTFWTYFLKTTVNLPPVRMLNIFYRRRKSFNFGFLVKLTIRH